MRATPGFSADLLSALQASEALSDWINSQLGTTADLPSRLERIAMALFGIALEHRAAALLLVGISARTSAMALLRPVFEAYIRGYWMAVCATDEAAQAFMQGRGSPSLDSMVSALKKRTAAGAVLDRLRISHGPQFHDYTHGGGRQVSRWLKPDDIGPNHTDEEMASVVSYLDSIGLMVCIARELLAGRPADLFVERLNRDLEARATSHPVTGAAEPR